MSRRIIALAVTTVVAIFASTAAATTQPSGTDIQGPFLGSYVAILTTAQAVARGDARMAGRFTLVLRRNGTYAVSNPLDGTTRGKFEALSPKRLRFFKDNGCIAGGFERPQGGMYRWSLSGKFLTIRLVNEGPCSGRTQSLTYPVWKRH